MIPKHATELLKRAVDAWPQFDSEEEVNGAELVDWFQDFREKAKIAIANQGDSQNAGCDRCGVNPRAEGSTMCAPCDQETKRIYRE